mmetsp:Transcript_56630/g.132631  ORF Transcript_56630/g.132631 Transcript_56630/m.132631 type:complete len:310 (-) Transcript_56630:60-989(-)
MLTTPALVTQPQFFLQSTTIRSMQRQSTASRHSSHRSPKLHMQIHEEKLSCKRIFRPISVVLSSLIIASSFPHGAQSFITPPPSQLQMPAAGGSPGFPRTLKPDLRPRLGMAAESVVEEHVKTNSKDGMFVLTPKDKVLEEALFELMQKNPTRDPGDWKDDDKTARLATGTWEVAYAPHIATLQKLGTMDFGPIRYILGASSPNERTIVSNVQYKSPLFGQGWFNAAGSYSSLTSDKVRIEFDTFWWDRDSAAPSPPPSSPPRTLVQTLGKAGFIPAFSRFPVRYLDGTTCVFEFELTGTSILARKLPQ